MELKILTEEEKTYIAISFFFFSKKVAGIFCLRFPREARRRISPSPRKEKTETESSLIIVK